ncbi:MAG TPA: hypothetical protein VI299_26530 [Polyangiales bacterium]
MKIDRTLTLAMLVPLLASGCFELEDLESVGPEDASSRMQDAPVDATVDATVDAVNDFKDAGDAGEDAVNDFKDAGDASVDAGWFDAHTEPPAPCSETGCAEGEVCTPGGSCIERCDASGVCLVASTKRMITALMSDGPVLYVALGSTWDRLGNMAPDAELRTLIGDGELTLLTMLPENATRLESHGDHVYWTGTRPDGTAKKLRRIAKGAVSGPEALYASAGITGNIILSDTHVALRKADGIYVGSLDGTAELRKVQDCPAVAQNAADVCYPMAFGEGSLFYLGKGEPTAFDNEPTTLSAVDLVTNERKQYGPGYHDTRFLAVEPPYLYLSATSYGTAQLIYRRDLRDLALPDFTMWLGPSPYYSFPDARAIQSRGDWVYVLAAEYVFGNGENRKRLVFERMAKAGPVNVQSILPDTFGDTGSDQYVDYALTDSHAFLAVQQTSQTGLMGSLIYRIPLPR